MAKKNIFKSKTPKAKSANRPKSGGNGTGRSTDEAESAPEPGLPPLPLFYKDPQPLHYEAHARKALKQPIDYRFAASAHAVILHTREFRLAAANYPIVFADHEGAMPLAILGYRDGQNLFVDGAGKWADGTYIPAYVRRYPFATGQSADQDEMFLYADLASDLIVDLDANPEADALFVAGEPSERTKQALEFCRAFQQQAPVTSDFMEEIKNQGLLGSKEVRLDLPSGDSQLLTGLRVIEEDKFNALPDEVYLDWRRRGWIALVYWHWASMDNFLRLVQRG